MTRLKCQITGQYLYSHYFPKFFETVIYNRLQFHINSNNILVQEQYSFRTNSSAKIATYNLINDILTALDNKLIGGGLSCNLTKAFDCVKHDILLGKLEHCGINDKAGDLKKSYLNDRYQREIIKHEYYKNTSVRDKVRHSVPQDSIFGPLFFLLYIKDVPYIISNISTSTLFADDTSIKFSNSDSTDHATEFIMTFDNINLWIAVVEE